MTGHEKHLREMIKGQQQKIARCLERIAEIEKELSDYLEALSPPLPPFSVPPVDNHDYCGKILYPSEKAAHAARKLINRDLKKKGKELMRRAYFCDKWVVSQFHFMSSTIFSIVSGRVVSPASIAGVTLKVL